MEKAPILIIHGGSAYCDQTLYLEHLRTVPIKDPLTEAEKSVRWTDGIKDLLPDRAVYQPRMPNKHNSRYDEWRVWFERYLTYIRDGATLVGWSQGGMFLMKYLIENEVPYEDLRLVLLAAPYEADLAPNQNLTGEDGGDFLFDTARVGEIAGKVASIDILHSTDDFIVPFRHAEWLSAQLPEATLHTYHDKNHFLIPEFPEFVELVR